ncbi:hypothetical protein [Brevibacillus sp. SYSU BS000544]|uniref:hypothetical protein n=1 Tax=Brevibacillus sp. SYSU BS000544 TaxID=3416443 RepID=UPI003CE59CDF
MSTHIRKSTVIKQLEEFERMIQMTEKGHVSSGDSVPVDQFSYQKGFNEGMIFSMKSLLDTFKAKLNLHE